MIRLRRRLDLEILAIPLVCALTFHDSSLQLGDERFVAACIFTPGCAIDSAIKREPHVAGWPYLEPARLFRRCADVLTPVLVASLAEDAM